MSDQTTNTANPTMAFILGAIVVALLGIGYFVYTGTSPAGDEPEIQIDLGGALEGDGGGSSAGASASSDN